MKTSQTPAADPIFTVDDTTQLRRLLDEIEHEDVPERLLKLARELQDQLVARRGNAG